MNSPAIYPIPGFNEPFSSISHLIGAGVFVVLGAMLLLRGRGDRLRTVSLTIYVVSALFLFLASGLYHLVERDTAIHAMVKRFDFAAIFVFIAATFTLPHIVLFRGAMRWTPIVLIWAIAAVGLMVRSVLAIDLNAGASVGVYLAMGWVGLFSAGVVWKQYGVDLVRPLFAGALFYTVGALIHYACWPTLVVGVIGPHEVWHLAVLFGAICHWTFIYQFAAGAPPRKKLARDEAEKAKSVAVV